MCKSNLHSFLQALPKCEHHIHLEGALTPRLLFKFAARNGIQLPTDDPAFASIEALQDRYSRFTSLDDFLGYYYTGMQTMVSESDFEALAWDYFEHASADGVVHAEVFFDPQAHLSGGVSCQTVLKGFNAARSRADKEFGISSELICCFLRHLPVSDSLETFELDEIRASVGRGDIAGIGLDSSEKGYPPELFKELYQRAKAVGGLRLTAHAGEEGPVSYISSAIDVLGIERIDHGIRLADDPELLKRVVQRGTMLTICPLSNVLLQCVKSVGELPIRKFLDAGVSFSINSDDPAYFGNHYILDNYCAVQEAFELSIKEWEKICEASIRGSWCHREREGELFAMLETIIDEWERKE